MSTFNNATGQPTPAPVANTSHPSPCDDHSDHNGSSGSLDLLRIIELSGGASSEHGSGGAPSLHIDAIIEADIRLPGVLGAGYGHAGDDGGLLCGLLG
jgi:hypothetical protein